MKGGSFINSEYDIFTMTPNSLDYGYLYIATVNIGCSINGFLASNEAYVRPVIAVKGDIFNFKGSGSNSDPYTIN